MDKRTLNLPFPLLPAILLLIIGLLTTLTIAFSDILNTTENRNPGSLKQVFSSEVTDAMRVPILLYHNVDGSGPFSVSLKTLRSHLNYLKKNSVTVITLEQLITMQKNGEKPPSKSCVITVDDGYESAYSKLFPLVKEYDYPMTLFVYTDFIFSRSTKLMTWEKLREMDQNGFDIQNHTISHPDLVKLLEGGNEERNRLYRELALSKKILETRLGKKIKYIAYPYGSYNEELNSISKKIGYQNVFSTDYGANISSDYTFCLNRHHIKSNYTTDHIKKILAMK
jgi:peptidoglycan/xylan/chitin deacetylase (PgdA/CDA1 family)